MSTRADVEIHANGTQVLIYVSLFGKVFVGTIDIDVIADLHDKLDMTPDEAQAYVVTHQQAFGPRIASRAMLLVCPVRGGSRFGSVRRSEARHVRHLRPKA